MFSNGFFLWVVKTQDYVVKGQTNIQQYVSYIAVASEPIHAFLEFFQPVLRTIFFPSHWLLYHKGIVETNDSGEIEINSVPMTIINPWKEYWPTPGIKPATSCSQVPYTTP